MAAPTVFYYGGRLVGPVIDETKFDSQGHERHSGIVYVDGARTTLTTQTLFAHELRPGPHLFAHDARGEQCGAVNLVTAAHWHPFFVSGDLEGHCVTDSTLKSSKSKIGFLVPVVFCLTSRSAAASDAVESGIQAVAGSSQVKFTPLTQARYDAAVARAAARPAPPPRQRSRSRSRSRSREQSPQ